MLFVVHTTLNKSYLILSYLILSHLILSYITYMHQCIVYWHIMPILTHKHKGTPGPWFNIKMSSYQYRKSHCGDKTVVRSSYLHNGISYTDKMTSLYWIRALGTYQYRITRLFSIGTQSTLCYWCTGAKAPGHHVWNILPIDIKNSLSICEFKNLIKLWPGPTCNC